jgi:hypothetical protein
LELRHLIPLSEPFFRSTLFQMPVAFERPTSLFTEWSPEQLSLLTAGLLPEGAYVCRPDLDTHAAMLAPEVNVPAMDSGVDSDLTLTFANRLFSGAIPLPASESELDLALYSLIDSLSSYLSGTAPLASLCRHAFFHAPSLLLRSFPVPCAIFSSVRVFAALTYRLVTDYNRGFGFLGSDELPHFLLPSTGSANDSVPILPSSQPQHPLVARVNRPGSLRLAADAATCLENLQAAASLPAPTTFTAACLSLVTALFAAVMPFSGFEAPPIPLDPHATGAWMAAAASVASDPNFARYHVTSPTFAKHYCHHDWHSFPPRPAVPLRAPAFSAAVLGQVTATSAALLSTATDFAPIFDFASLGSGPISFDQAALSALAVRAAARQLFAIVSPPLGANDGLGALPRTLIAAASRPETLSALLPLSVPEQGLCCYLVPRLHPAFTTSAPAILTSPVSPSAEDGGSESSDSSSSASQCGDANLLSSADATALGTAMQCIWRVASTVCSSSQSKWGILLSEIADDVTSARQALQPANVSDRIAAFCDALLVDIFGMQACLPALSLNALVDCPAYFDISSPYPSSPLAISSPWQLPPYSLPATAPCPQPAVAFLFHLSLAQVLSSLALRSLLDRDLVPRLRELCRPAAAPISAPLSAFLDSIETLEAAKQALPSYVGLLASFLLKRPPIVSPSDMSSAVIVPLHETLRSLRPLQLPPASAFVAATLAKPVGPLPQLSETHRRVRALLSQRTQAANEGDHAHYRHLADEMLGLGLLAALDRACCCLEVLSKADTSFSCVLLAGVPALVTRGPAT